MINFVHESGLGTEYVTFDSWYTSKAILATLKNYGCSYVYIVKSNRGAVYNNRINLNVKTIPLIFSKKQSRYNPGTGFYIKSIEVYMPGIGKVKLAIVKNSYNITIQNTRFIIKVIFLQYFYPLFLSNILQIKNNFNTIDRTVSCL
jgi:hypothetical protein